MDPSKSSSGAASSASPQEKVSRPNRAQSERNAKMFHEGLTSWREWVVDLQRRLCRDLVAIAFANRACLGANPVDWVNECIDNYWVTHRPGFKNWAVLCCDWADPEGWTAPGWLLGEVPEEILELHIQTAPLAETLDGRVYPPYTELIQHQIASLLEMRIYMARIAVLDDAKIKIASEPAAKRAKPSASSVERVNEAVYAIDRRYGNEWDKKWLDSTRELYAELHPGQVKHAVDESSSAEPEAILKLKLIEPLVPMFVAQTIEPIPVWIKANEGPHTGLVAYFSNTSGASDRESMPALGVIARVVYTRTHGERFIVVACCWLDWPKQRIDFKPGETRKLVLAIVTEGEQTVFALENRREQVPIGGAYDQGIMPLPLGELPFRAELVLIDDKGRTVFETEFLLERDKNRIIAARKAGSAQLDDGAVMDGTRMTQVAAEGSVQTSQSATASGNESVRIQDRRAEKWEDIEISFTSEERIQITVAGKSDSPTYNYEEFGLFDRRNRRPNLAWITLRLLAEDRGTLKQSPSGQRWSDIEKRMQELRAHLRKHFGLQDDPLPFVNGIGYRAEFKINCSPSYQT
jgi:hypothetical protein